MNHFQLIRHDLSWYLVTRIILIVFTICFRVRVRFYNDLPKGGYIVATNHISHFDPPFIASHFPEKIDWLGMAELFHGKILHAFFTSLGVIPIGRNQGDRAALRTATKRLADGKIIGIFPEGGIRDGDASVLNGAPIKGGTAVIASLSGAPILAGVILGSDRMYNGKNWRPWRRKNVWIGFGQAVQAPEGLSSEERRTYLQTALAAEIVSVKDRLCKDFSLTEDDLPHPPKQRMIEG